MGLYYNMTFKNVYPANRYAELATIPVIERGEIKNDRYSIAGRDGELIGIDTWRGNAHVRLTLHTKSDWYTSTRQNVDDNLNTLKKWLSGTGELKIISNKEGYNSNYITHILEVLQITTNEIRKNNDYGRLEVDFEVYPLNFLPSANVEQSSVDNKLTVYNSGDFGMPIISIKGTSSGTGTLYVGGHTAMEYTLEANEWLTIDSRRMIAYTGNTNKSSSVNGDYKNMWLGNGATLIQVSSGHIFKVIPQWGYRL